MIKHPLLQQQVRLSNKGDPHPAYLKRKSLMSSTPPAYEKDAPKVGDAARVENHEIWAAAATTATATESEPRPDIPPRSPHRPRPESEPVRTEVDTMSLGSGGTIGQSSVLQTTNSHIVANNCRVNLPSSNTDLPIQDHGTETTHLGGSGSRTGGEDDRPIEEAPPPAYSEFYGKVDISQDGFDTQARVASVFQLITS